MNYSINKFNYHQGLLGFYVVALGFYGKLNFPISASDTLLVDATSMSSSRALFEKP